MKVRFVSVAERQARVRAEAQAVARVKAQGQVPRACGTEMAEAPARGAIRLVTPVARRVVNTPEDGQKPGNANRPEGGNRVERHDLGYEGRKAAQICDVFDLMAVRARRTQFTRAQIATARRYAGLVERHSKGAMKCSSMESAHGGSGGSGGQGAFMDSYLQEGREIERLRRQAGFDPVTGAAAVVLARKDGTGRRVMALDLLDRVCLAQHTPTQVLRDLGWSASTRHLARCRKALADCLDRMAR
nr:hypothetical protein [uncultured Celeribacter sp.]